MEKSDQDRMGSGIPSGALLNSHHLRSRGSDPLPVPKASFKSLCATLLAGKTVTYVIVDQWLLAQLITVSVPTNEAIIIFEFGAFILGNLMVLLMQRQSLKPSIVFRIV